MKKILLLLITIFLFAAPISTKDAFKPSFKETKNSVIFTLKMAKGVHIYKKSLKIFVNNKPYKITLPPPQKDTFGDKVYFNKITFKLPKKNITIKYQGCGHLVCYTPQSVNYKIKKQPKKIEIQKTKPQKTQTQKIVNLFNKSIWIILGSFFVFGLLLSLTPCIFPTIPILSGLLVKNTNENSHHLKGFLISLIYVLSMAVTYTIAGVLAGIFGSNIQALFQNPFIITTFSLIFVALAFSMFGFFEIGLPSSIQTKIMQKSNSAANKGGIIGVAIMGFLSALIVGPCIAPPLAGALIYIGKSGNAFLGGSALFVMSIGMGVPLLILGLGAGKLLPKAGNWMMAINKIFGVIMLGVAIWMISRIIPEKITDILWSVLFIGSGLYLNPFSKMQNYKDVIIKTIGFFLILIGALFFYKPFLKLNNQITIQQKKWQKVSNLQKLENIINNNQNVIVDFSAKWCVACKELEENTFSNPNVENILKNYKLIRIDITNPDKNLEKIIKKYKIIGPPVILIFKNHKLILKTTGYKSPEKFKKLLNQSS